MTKLIILLAVISFLGSCAAPQKPKKLYPEVSMTRIHNSQPKVVKTGKAAYRYRTDKKHYPEHLNRLIKIYGHSAKKRMTDWQYTINDYQRKSDFQKLHIANSFINRLSFIDDQLHWNQDDYWATPMETLASKGGDCEDFAIAKYYMLSKMGIPKQCLTLNYVTVKNYDKPHMVLTYQCQIQDQAIVLDNLNPKLLSIQQRRDLTPVYSFNHDGVWFTNKLGKQQKLSRASRLRMWDNLRYKIRLENF